MVNASRVIKYVAILGYRAYSYPLVEMRVHDINVVADLDQHRPPEPVALDGTVDGAATNSNRATQESSSQRVAAEYLKGYWTLPWPVYHLYVLATPTLTLLHVAIDLLFTIEVLQIGIIEWFLDEFGIPYERFEYYTGLLGKEVDKVLFAVMTLFLEEMVASMMIYDYTKALPALAAGSILWLVTAGIAHGIAQFYAVNLSNPIMAGYVWLSVLTISLGNIVGGLFFDRYISGGRKLAKQVASVVGKLGGRIPWSGSRIRFAWASLISLALLIGLSIFWIKTYGDY